jgi:ABC-type sulfate transport system permease component
VLKFLLAVSVAEVEMKGACGAAAVLIVTGLVVWVAFRLLSDDDAVSKFQDDEWWT